ncbi:hypothetical protein, unlikely [Trypanosoma congolense IL3000]|uniref:T. congolense-specific, cell surface-expressed gene family n=1 Tax=Trypanosoma congolense (strain IL3000) TaxID=1068625 RepID=F9WBU3_TRYCI|nr:hypothetical protein, unlikely [Trypanosoma congolense IL3000]
MALALTRCWSLTVCIMRSWLYNCLPSWSCSSDMPRRRSFPTPPCKPVPVMPVGGTHANMPRSIVWGDTPFNIFHLTPECTNFLFAPGFPECEHRPYTLNVALESLSKRIHPHVSHYPCPAFHDAFHPLLCEHTHIEQSIALVT